MAARQGATDAQIADALRKGLSFLSHLTGPDSGYLEDRLAVRQSDQKWDTGKEVIRQKKKTCTTFSSVQEAETPPSLLAADALDLLQFLNNLTVYPVEAWSRTWAADRTMMLRMTSKQVREAVDKLCPPTHVKLGASFLHNAVNFTSAWYYTFDATQRSALKRERMQHILTQLDSWEDMISPRHNITKLDLNHCDMRDHEAGFLVAVHNEIGAEGADILNELGLGDRRNWEVKGEKFEGEIYKDREQHLYLRVCLECVSYLW
jgi:hypothetical protein